MDATKRPALEMLARVLDGTATPYAIVGGVTLQVQQAEPRTTLDIDLVVPGFEAIPREALQRAGCSPSGRASPRSPSREMGV
jgi:hypothetical protein